MNDDRAIAYWRARVAETLALSDAMPAWFDRRNVERHLAARLNQENDMPNELLRPDSQRASLGRYNAGDDYPPASPVAPPRDRRTIETFIARLRGMNDMAEICSQRLQNCIERLAMGPTPHPAERASEKSPHEPPELHQLDNLLAQLEGRLQQLGDQVGQIEQL